MDQTCWLTAVVLALLENKFDDEKESWEMMAEKAMKWLKASGCGSDLIEKAKAFIQK